MILFRYLLDNILFSLLRIKGDKLLVLFSSIVEIFLILIILFSVFKFFFIISGSFSLRIIFFRIFFSESIFDFLLFTGQNNLENLKKLDLW